MDNIKLYEIDETTSIISPAMPNISSTTGSPGKPMSENTLA